MLVQRVTKSSTNRIVLLNYASPVVYASSDGKKVCYARRDPLYQGSLLSGDTVTTPIQVGGRVEDRNCVGLVM